MRISQLKEWLSELPTEFDDNVVVFRKMYEDPNDSDRVMCIDTPIVGVGIDEENNEMYLCDADSDRVLNEE